MLFDDIRGPVNRGMDVMKLWNLYNEQILSKANDSTSSQIGFLFFPVCFVFARAFNFGKFWTRNKPFILSSLIGKDLSQCQVLANSCPPNFGLVAPLCLL